MSYQPKHSAEGEQPHDEEALLDLPLDEVVQLPKEVLNSLSRETQQELINMMLLEMIQELFARTKPLLLLQRLIGDTDPLETALAYGGADAE